MFPLPYARPFDLVLYALLGLEIVLLAGGLAFGKPNADRTCRLPLLLLILLRAPSITCDTARFRAFLSSASTGR